MASKRKKPRYTGLLSFQWIALEKDVVATPGLEPGTSAL